ncbi:hypothetical protein HYU96_00955 [Candidatus Daviesbacteria bacterium]|nr:hypothetical protein [Candidatus Daviesbacteria bacterium]
MKIVRDNPLFFAFLLPAFVDSVITLLGQTPQYWSQQRIVNEANPVYYFLLVSPWLYIIGSIIWFAIWYWVIKKIKEPFNIFLMFLFTIGHSWGSSTWILRFLREQGLFRYGDQLSQMIGWAIIILYFSIVALFASYFLLIYLKKKINYSK